MRKPEQLLSRHGQNAHSLECALFVEKNCPEMLRVMLTSLPGSRFLPCPCPPTQPGRWLASILVVASRLNMQFRHAACLQIQSICGVAMVEFLKAHSWTVGEDGIDES